MFAYTASSGVEISGNTLAPGQIILDGSSTCNSCVVKDNTVGTGTGNGIQLFNMTGGSISSNTVSGRTANGIALLASSGVAITGNTSTDNSASGIVIATSHDVTVTENIILRNTGNPGNPGGLTLKGSDDGKPLVYTYNITVANNTINNNGQFGVWIRYNAGSGDVFHFNNIVDNGSSTPPRIHTGMLNNSTAVINAENNWWGSQYGPYNASLNATGTDNGAGDISTDGTVDFNPWITGLMYTGATVFPGPGPVVLQAKLVNSDEIGLPATIPEVTVEFFANGVSQGVVTTDANGVAEKTVSLPLGANNIRAVITEGGLLSDCLAGIEVTASVFGEGPGNGILLPTSTTVKMYAGGPSAWPAMYDAFYYKVKSGRINSVSPGVIFYYNTITAPSAAFTLTVEQTNDLGWPPMLVQRSGKPYQAFLYDANTFKILSTGTSGSTGNVTFNVTKATLTATYYIGIKYTPSNLVGQTATNLTSTYTFQTMINGVFQVGSKASIEVRKK
jgi:parallel beta-helix repeat protein